MSETELDELAKQIGEEAIDLAFAELDHREDFAELLEAAERRIRKLVSEYMDET